MLGVNFATDFESLRREIGTAIRVFGGGLDLISRDKELAKGDRLGLVRYNVTCQDGPIRWEGGFRLYKYLLNVTLQSSTAETRRLQTFI